MKKKKRAKSAASGGGNPDGGMNGGASRPPAAAPAAPQWTPSAAAKSKQDVASLGEASAHGLAAFMQKGQPPVQPPSSAAAAAAAAAAAEDDLHQQRMLGMIGADSDDMDEGSGSDSGEGSGSSDDDDDDDTVWESSTAGGAAPAISSPAATASGRQGPDFHPDLPPVRARLHAPAATCRSSSSAALSGRTEIRRADRAWGANRGPALDLSGRSPPCRGD